MHSPEPAFRANWPPSPPLHVSSPSAVLSRSRQSPRSLRSKSVSTDLQRRAFETDHEALLEAQGLAARPGRRQRIDRKISAAIAEAIKACRILEVAYQSRNDKSAHVRRLAPDGRVVCAHVGSYFAFCCKAVLRLLQLGIAAWRGSTSHSLVLALLETKPLARKILLRRSSWRLRNLSLHFWL